MLYRPSLFSVIIFLSHKCNYRNNIVYGYTSLYPSRWFRQYTNTITSNSISTRGSVFTQYLNYSGGKSRRYAKKKVSDFDGGDGDGVVGGLGAVGGLDGVGGSGLGISKKQIDRVKVKSLAPQYKPRGQNQIDYLKCLMDSDTKLVIGVGPAGCGKTLFAVYTAIQ